MIEHISAYLSQMTASLLASVLCAASALARSGCGGGSSGLAVDALPGASVLAVAPEPSLRPRLQADLCAEPLGADRGGDRAGVERHGVAGAAGARRGDAPRPRRLSSAARFRIPATEIDKILLVAVAEMPGGLTVTARDFDVRTRTFKPAVVRPVWQARRLGRHRLRRVDYRPSRRWRDRSRGKRSVVSCGRRRRACRCATAELALFARRRFPADHSLQRPEGKFNNTAPVPWIFVCATKILREEVQCRVQPGMRARSPRAARGRVEPLALSVVPPGGLDRAPVAIAERTPKAPWADTTVYSCPPGGKDHTLLGRLGPPGPITRAAGRRATCECCW